MGGNTVYYKTPEEVEIMREAALMVSHTLALVGNSIREGVTTLHLDRIAEEYIKDHNGVPGFKGYNKYPYTLCTSVNNQVVHGMPANKPLKSGDIVSVDCGIKYKGFYGDHAYTFTVGEVKNEIMQLIKVTKESLFLGIEQARKGNRIEDIGYAIQQHAESNGYSVVRELVGHGVGRSLHEGPEVPNYGKRGSGRKIKNGLVLAIEPMINMGKRNIYTHNDGWTILTADGLPSAHFEHDVAIVNGKPEILSSFEIIEEGIKGIMEIV